MDKRMTRNLFTISRCHLESLSQYIRKLSESKVHSENQTEMIRSFFLLSLLISAFLASKAVDAQRRNAAQECNPGSVVNRNCKYCSCDNSGRVTTSCVKLYSCDDDLDNKK